MIEIIGFLVLINYDFLFEIIGFLIFKWFKIFSSGSLHGDFFES